MVKSSFTSSDLFKIHLVGDPAVSPCGKRVVFVRTDILEKENDYVSSLWLYDEKGLRQITNLSKTPKGRDTAPSWSPDCKKLAFLSTRQGQRQLWVLDFQGGEARQITDMPLGVEEFSWGPDSRTVYLSAKEKTKECKMREGSTARRITRLRYKFNGTGYLDPFFTQIWKLDVQTGKLEKLTDGPHDCHEPKTSPSGELIAFVSNRSDKETDLYTDLWVVRPSSKELVKLTESKGRVTGPVWSTNSRYIYYLGHEKGVYPGGYPQIWEVDVTNGKRRVISGEFPYLIGGRIGADVRFDSGKTGLSLSDDGSFLYFVAVTGGNSYLYQLNIKTGKWKKIYGAGQMAITSYDASGGGLAVNLATPATPGDIWYGRISGAEESLCYENSVSEGSISKGTTKQRDETSGKLVELKQVTDFNGELFASRHIGWPERVDFYHPDGTKLEGWIIKPKDFDPSKKYPMVMEIHGGPHTTYGNVFFHEFQILAGHGFAVLYTNPRGSLGYGEKFARAVVGDWCGVDARDLEFMAKDTLRRFSWVDPERFGVTGGSQGGYLTNWLISHTGIFKAAVTQRSMSNLYSKYGVSDIGWSGDRAGMGGKDLWNDEDLIMERSPIRYAPNVRAPVLIIHSDQDFRCPLEQAEQWYVALKRLGVTTELLLFHGENHELSRSGKPANRVVRLDAILDWFQKYLTKSR